MRTSMGRPMTPHHFMPVILSAAKDPRGKSNARHRLGSFAALRMTVRRNLFPAGLIAMLALLAPQLAAETFEESGRAAHEMLTRLCDDFGGRVTGSPANNGALERLAGELRKLGLQPELESFKMPGWERGEDRVELVVPLARSLR